MSDKPSAVAPRSTDDQAPRPELDLVLDTNVLLALWLFQDPTLEPLRRALDAGRVRWIATSAMLEELDQVASRPFPARYRPSSELRSPPAQLQLAPASPAPWRCRDGADQKFLDLAWALQLPLCSRDRDLLSLRRRGAARGLRIEPPEQTQAQLDRA